MRIKFWGVRGSTPTPQPENLRYGGNTSCVEVRLGDHLYIFDCGTGFRSLGQQLHREFDSSPIRAHIFVSHFHWDHIQGIPFFGPLYDNPENCFSFHSSCRFRTLKRVMEEQMAAPYFPVDMSEMKAQRGFYNLEQGRVPLDDVMVEAMWLNHPQGCMGYRLETKDGVLVYATDNEPVNVVMESGAKELILFHHDPDHDDACVDQVVEEARNHYPNVRAAAEGLEIEL